MNTRNPDGSITFTFTLEPHEAQVFVDILQSDVVKWLDLAADEYKVYGESNVYTAYKAHSKYSKDLKEKILKGTP